MGFIRETIAAGLRAFAGWIADDDDAPTQRAGEKRPRSAADERDISSKRETHRVRVDEEGTSAPVMRERETVAGQVTTQAQEPASTVLPAEVVARKKAVPKGKLGHPLRLPREDAVWIERQDQEVEGQDEAVPTVSRADARRAKAEHVRRFSNAFKAQQEKAAKADTSKNSAEQQTNKTSNKSAPQLTKKPAPYIYEGTNVLVTPSPPKLSDFKYSPEEKRRRDANATEIKQIHANQLKRERGPSYTFVNKCQAKITTGNNAVAPVVICEVEDASRKVISLFEEQSPRQEICSRPGVPASAAQGAKDPVSGGACKPSTPPGFSADSAAKATAQRKAQPAAESITEPIAPHSKQDPVSTTPSHTPGADIAAIVKSAIVKSAIVKSAIVKSAIEDMANFQRELAAAARRERAEERKDKAKCHKQVSEVLAQSIRSQERFTDVAEKMTASSTTVMAQSTSIQERFADVVEKLTASSTTVTARNVTTRENLEQAMAKTMLKLWGPRGMQSLEAPHNSQLTTDQATSARVLSKLNEVYASHKEEYGELSAANYMVEFVKDLKQTGVDVTEDVMDRVRRNSENVRSKYQDRMQPQSNASQPFRLGPLSQAQPQSGQKLVEITKQDGMSVASPSVPRQTEFEKHFQYERQRQAQEQKRIGAQKRDLEAQRQQLAAAMQHQPFMKHSTTDSPHSRSRFRPQSGPHIEPQTAFSGIASSHTQDVSRQPTEDAMEIDSIYPEDATDEVFQSRQTRGANIQSKKVYPYRSKGACRHGNACHRLHPETETSGMESEGFSEGVEMDLDKVGRRGSGKAKSKPCRYASRPGGCRKRNCPYLHLDDSDVEDHPTLGYGARRNRRAGVLDSLLGSWEQEQRSHAQRLDYRDQQRRDQVRSRPATTPRNPFANRSSPAMPADSRSHRSNVPLAVRELQRLRDTLAPVTPPVVFGPGVYPHSAPPLMSRGGEDLRSSRRDDRRYSGHPDARHGVYSDTKMNISSMVAPKDARETTQQKGPTSTGNEMASSSSDNDDELL